MLVEEGWVCNGTRCAVAGDAIVTWGVEECDDGNQRDGDGCSAKMLIEDGWHCVRSCSDNGNPSCCYKDRVIARP